MYKKKGDRRKRNKEKDPTWDHCLHINDDKTSRLKLKCNYCSNEYWGGVIRIKNHLAHIHKDVKPCLKVPEDVKNYFAKLLENIKKKKKMSNLMMSLMLNVFKKMNYKRLVVIMQKRESWMHT